MRYPALLALLLACPALAQAPDPPAPADSAARRVLAAAPAAGPLSIDGRLDEAAWNAAAVATGFTESYPDAGQPAPQGERTEARVLYTDDAVLVGVRMYDPHPDSIAAPLARRDAGGIYSDWLHVILDSYHDRRTAFRFSVNPRGVKRDVYVYNDGNEDGSWDAVWEVAARMDSLGWTAEYRIPLSQLRFQREAGGEGRVWGLQVMRDVARREQRYSWSPWTRRSPGFVSRFGELHGLGGIQPVRRMELQPYVSTRLTRAPDQPGNPFYRANDAGLAVGADVKLGLTSGLTLTGTINPDFGQVEVDPAVVNLSAFETFFQEKRPFFVEGADVFRFGQVRSFININSKQFFYSRRVGRAPQRGIGGPDVQFVDAPGETTILGAAKVTGKQGPWTIGLMDALTARETAALLTGGGETVRAPVEPRTNYLLGRLRREFRQGGTVVGGMATATHRAMSDSVFHPLLRSDAYFGGVDFEHAWARRAWVLSGYLAATRVEGSPDAIRRAQLSPARYYQRPDADYLELDPTRTALDGHMAEIALQHSGSWDMSLGYSEAAPGFEINDLGFQGRTDSRQVTAMLGQRVEKPGWLFRDHARFVYGAQGWNFGGDRNFALLGGGINGTLKKLWSVGIGANLQPERLDDRLTRGGPIALSPTQWELDAFVSTDPRHRLSFFGRVDFSGSVEGESGGSASVSADLRPSTATRVQVGPRLSWGHGTAQYVRTAVDPLAMATFGRRYLFADIDRTTLSMDVRLDWTFTPGLSLQLFAQPFVAAGEYSEFKEFVAPGTYRFAVFGRDRGTLVRQTGPGGDRLTVDPDGQGPAAPVTFADPSFNVRSLRGNAVLRWEYRPGSTLFFVWQQQRSGFEPVGSFRPGHDYGELFSAPATNVFLIKASYWLGR